MIKAITGLPGDGKSLLGTEWLIEDLVVGEVFVASNVPLLLPELRAYVVQERKRRGIDLAFDLDESLRVLKDEEVFEFYRIRSGGLVLDVSPDRLDDGLGGKQKSSERLEKEAFIALMKKNLQRVREKPEYMRPVHYYIDEVHNFFSSRDWATNGRSTLYYASQHRHLHDNVWLISQKLENVEKQLRGLVSETYITRNYLTRSVGPFKMRPVFEVRAFYGCTFLDTDATPFQKRTYYLDVKGVAACYETAGALGIHKKAEVIANKGWIPWWVLPVGGLVGVLALGLGMAMVPRLMINGVGRLISRSVPKSMSQLTGVKSPSQPASVSAVSSPVGGSSRRVDPSEPKVFVFDGVSGIDEGRGIYQVHLPAFGEWFSAILAAPGVYRLSSGAVARQETVEERRQRLIDQAKAAAGDVAEAEPARRPKT